MAKKKATKAAVETNNALARLNKNPNGAKTLGQLSVPEQKAFGESLAEMIENQRKSHYAIASAAIENLRHHYEVEIPDWLESLGMERDLALATQVALAEYHEFLTRDEIDDCETATLIELIKTVAAKKEWERRIAARNKLEPRWSKPANHATWLEWHKQAGCEISSRTLDRCIADGGDYTVHTPRKRSRIIIDINTLPLKMQSQDFWDSL